jgi:hypothetical protein
MFKKVLQSAERQAAQFPRRAFLGAVAKAALPAATLLGGLLVMTRDARAIGRGAWYCCYDSAGNAVCQTRNNDWQSCCPEGTKPGPCSPNKNRPACPC